MAFGVGVTLLLPSKVLVLTICNYWPPEEKGFKTEDLPDVIVVDSEPKPPALLMKAVLRYSNSPSSSIQLDSMSKNCLKMIEVLMKGILTKSIR